jgi:hypothetical protein
LNRLAAILGTSAPDLAGLNAPAKPGLRHTQEGLLPVS